MWTSQLLGGAGGGVSREIGQKELRWFLLFFVEH